MFLIWPFRESLWTCSNSLPSRLRKICSCISLSCIRSSRSSCNSSLKGAWWDFLAFVWSGGGDDVKPLWLFWRPLAEQILCWIHTHTLMRARISTPNVLALSNWSVQMCSEKPRAPRELRSPSPSCGTPLAATSAPPAEALSFSPRLVQRIATQNHRLPLLLHPNDC